MTPPPFMRNQEENPGATPRAADDPVALADAAQALREGRLVVFPTETVYGVGADGKNADAVSRIFDAKGRPADNPLIVHVADVDAARALTSRWPDAAKRLADAFWPGPLTLVLPKAEDVPDITTGGLDSVAVRVPDHEAARALCRESGVAVAAPSANRSGRPSPTRVEDARADLKDAVAVYLDGGPSRVGVESTVVSVMEETPVLLRPGGVTLEDLERVVGTVTLGLDVPPDAAPRSPGQKYAHYAPANADVHVVEGDRASLETYSELLRSKGHRVAIVATEEHAPLGNHVRVPGSRADVAAWARQLFALLRDLDAEGYDAIVIEGIPEDGLGRAVMNRLRKAQKSVSGT